jgi:hypothetical protein
MLDGEEQFLLRRLNAAERAVRDAAGLLPLYRDDDTVRDSILRLAALVGSLREALEK